MKRAITVAVTAFILGGAMGATAAPFGTAWARLTTADKGAHLLEFTEGKPVDPLKVQQAFEYFSDSIGHLSAEYDKRIANQEAKTTKLINVVAKLTARVKTLELKKNPQAGDDR